jgi:alpha-tubulin suppressor-like RCC1 family protein
MSLDPADRTHRTPAEGRRAPPQDPVCQVSPNVRAWLAEVSACGLDATQNLSLPCAHFQYLNGETAKAATFMGPSLPPASLWPHLANTTPPDGTVGAPYTWTPGATPAGSYSWSSGGTLPPGLSFSAAGVLSGTPTQAGTFTFTITVTGAHGRNDTRNISLVVTSGTWASVSAGSTSTCATRTDGTLWCWGANGAGQLGTGDTTNRLSPIQVGTATSWAMVSAGNSDTCAVRTDHTLWCWGFNSAGQLGTGDTTDELTPTQVGVGASWATVSAGSNGGTCAIRTDDTLWCWGYNFFGPLGTGDTNDRLTPTQVGNATSWATVSAGNGSTCATRTDGTLWCWGRNDNGQLGTGDTTGRLTPTQVGIATSWATVSSGDAESACAIQTNGSLWCWGDNLSGDLGTGDSTSHLTPTRVGTASTWSTVSTGGVGSTCATQTNGTLWCWGENDLGQLSTGDTTDRLTPTGIS